MTCARAGSLRPRVSAAVCVLREQEWRPNVNKKTPNASHAKRVSVPDTAIQIEHGFEKPVKL